MISIQHIVLIILTTVCIAFNNSAQKVGVVLSGGGATGLCHVGVLMALEDAEIPIDYVTGTSAGALVGSMYACGYSPAQIRDYILTENFQRMSKGEMGNKEQFILREPEPNASMFTFRFAKDSILKKSLPTNFITPSVLDYEMLKIFGTTGASVNENFDSLFVPFRCVASDIANKKVVNFKSGKLNQAVRASMTYPFYVNPITVNGALLFDGGLYNNFPADIMYKDFDPDYIIGSNVSYNAASPNEDDLISQITNMLVTPTNYQLPCKSGIIITPSTKVGTFEFENAEIAIKDGYKSAQAYIDSIRLTIKDSISKEEVNKKRIKFRAKIIELNVSEVSAIDKFGDSVSFVGNSILGTRAKYNLTESEFSNNFYRTYAAPQVEYLYPTLTLKEDSTYAAEIYVKKQKTFQLDVGGLFSTRPVNTGYIGISVLGISKSAINLNTSAYFGKFYGSVKAGFDFEIPSRFPIRISPYFVLNKWDYFKSFSSFFEEEKPSFLVQNERYYGLNFNLPSGNQYKSKIDLRFFDLDDRYYQTENFTNKDTADITLFEGEAVSYYFTKNSLNRKQWANSGSYLNLGMKYVIGQERSTSGSTSPIVYDHRKRHRWFNLQLEGIMHPIDTKKFSIGVHGKLAFTSQSLFKNITASLLTTNEFSPLPDSRTYFFTEYRAPQFAGFGLNTIYKIGSRIDIRLDSYLFQPFKTLEEQENGFFSYSELFAGTTYMAGLTSIYHSPIGPVRASVNYFPEQNNPFTFQLAFGYVIFNERAIR